MYAWLCFEYGGLDNFLLNLNCFEFFLGLLPITLLVISSSPFQVVIIFPEKISEFFLGSWFFPCLCRFNFVCKFTMTDFEFLFSFFSSFFKYLNSFSLCYIDMLTYFA